MVDWITIVTPVISLLALWIGYVRYKAYVHEVQRDLFTSLEGREYPKQETEQGMEEVQFEVVNVNVRTSYLKDWNTLVVLKLDRDEFPWEGSKIEEFTHDMPEPFNSPESKNADSIEEIMEIELVRFCNIKRKAGAKFSPVFTDSVYGPALLLYFPTTNLFEIREQLELVSNVLPFLLVTWMQTMVGFDLKVYSDYLKGIAENPEFL